MRRKNSKKQDLYRLKLGGSSGISNSWIDRCKSLVKNFERTLENATTKINLCFVFVDAEKIGERIDPKWVL
jgi:hypothetical protein